MSLSKENKVIIDGQTYYGGLNQPPKFVKVNVDCWETIFDYLSLRDILSMSQTCQRMRQIGGYYFRENFHGTECELNADSDPVIDPWVYPVELERDDFLRFVDTVWIDSDLEHLKHYSSSDLLGSLTTLHLWDVELNADAIENFEKSVLDKIETVELKYCTIHDGFDGQLFTSCTKLKCLKIHGLFYISSTAENSLLRYTYPSLNHFEHRRCHEPASLFTSFLVRNSSIKSIRIHADYLLKMGLKSSTVQLDCLTIDFYRIDIDVIDFANLLKTLHANGFYKKLHLSLWDSSDDESLINEIRSFGALEVLKMKRFYANICHLTHLKELHLLEQPVGVVDLELIARKLTELERLQVCTVDHLLPFLRYSRSLKWAIFGNCIDADPLNLFELNRLRKLGGSQRKVLIGVYEDKYLSTKWESKNVKYDLVEITRAEIIRERFEYRSY